MLETKPLNSILTHFPKNQHFGVLDSRDMEVTLKEMPRMPVIAGKVFQMTYPWGSQRWTCLWCSGVCCLSCRDTVVLWCHNRKDLLPTCCTQRENTNIIWTFTSNLVLYISLQVILFHGWLHCCLTLYSCFFLSLVLCFSWLQISCHCVHCNFNLQSEWLLVVSVF